MAKRIRAKDEVLGELHLHLAKHLLDRLKTGEATPQELQAAIKFLKDNNVTGEPDDPDSPMKDIKAIVLPSFEDEALED